MLSAAVAVELQVLRGELNIAHFALLDQVSKNDSMPTQKTKHECRHAADQKDSAFRQMGAAGQSRAGREE